MVISLTLVPVFAAGVVLVVVAGWLGAAAMRADEVQRRSGPRHDEPSCATGPLEGDPAMKLQRQEQRLAVHEL